MSQQVASLYAEIGAKTDGFEKGAATVKGGLSGMSSQFSSIIPSSIMQFTSLGGAAMAVGVAIYGLEQAANAAAQGDARLEAVLKSTGEAAGYNFKQLDKMATGLSVVVGVDDDLIKKSMAVQATFTNIAGETFPAATQAALDLSAVLGSDLQSATIQVDKALNDFSGYTALKRAGVSFSQEQIKQIKNFKDTNDLAGYQKLILKELSKEFSGAAKAIYEAGDKSEGVAIAWGNLTEEAGGGLVPAMRSLNEYLISSIDGWNGFFQQLDAGNDAAERFAQSVGGPLYTSMAGWNAITKDQTVTQLTFNEQVAIQVDEMMAAAGANTAYVPTAEEVEAVNKAISEGNLAMVGSIQSLQDMEASYTEKSRDLTQQRMDIQAEMRDKMASANGLTIEEWQGLEAKLEEVKAKEAELAKEREIQSLKFISDLLLQKLSVDGLTTAEFDAFAKQQVAWGLWSEDVQKKAQAAYTEVDKIVAGIAEVQPKSVDINIHTNYTSDGTPPPSGLYNPPPTPAMASGGPAGGLTLVGENGMELVNLPTGSFVHPNRTSQNMNMAGGGMNIYVTYNASMDGADERQVAIRLKPAIMEVLRGEGLA
jgi:hypothetical protein